MPEQQAEDLQSLIDQLEQAPDGRDTSFRDMLDATGRRSFGPLLLVPGLLVMSPLGGVPGMATAVGLISLLVSTQLLIGRNSFWLPKWALDREVPSATFRRALRALRRPARWIDRLLRPRLQWMLRKPALHLIALGCVIVGFVMPLLEVVPFADTAPGAALTAFGLALISHDGALAMFAALLCALSIGFAGYAVLG